jgi:hypothetical protein
MNEIRKPKGPELLEDGQVAKAIFLREITGMKNILNMGEFRIGNRNSSEFKYFRKVVMDEYYQAMIDLFTKLQTKGVLKKCQCNADIREGYDACPLCNGAGWCNTEEFAEWINYDGSAEQGS